MYSIMGLTAGQMRHLGGRGTACCSVIYMQFEGRVGEEGPGPSPFHPLSTTKWGLALGGLLEFKEQALSGGPGGGGGGSRRGSGAPGPPRASH